MKEDEEQEGEKTNGKVRKPRVKERVDRRQNVMG